METQTTTQQTPSKEIIAYIEFIRNTGPSYGHDNPFKGYAFVIENGQPIAEVESFKHHYRNEKIILENISEKLVKGIINEEDLDNIVLSTIRYENDPLAGRIHPIGESLPLEERSLNNFRGYLRKAFADYQNDLAKRTGESWRTAYAQRNAERQEATE